MSDAKTPDREDLLDGWARAAGGWARQAERTSEGFRPVTDWMLERADLQPGRRVLELAAGPGELALEIASIVAPTKVLCSDGVQEMVDVAKERAEEEGVSNVEFTRLNLEWIDLPAASVDVIVCRFAVMLCVDPAAALRECRRVLAPGGQLVLSVWDQPEHNAGWMLPRIAATELGLLTAAVPAGPGPYALSAPGLLAEMLADAGFVDAMVEPVALSERYSSEVDWLGVMIDRSPTFGVMWRGLPDRDRVSLKRELALRAEPLIGSDGTITVPMQALAALAEA